MRPHPLVVPIAAGLFVALAWDGHLYWHDVRYLYATGSHDLGALMRGVWNPQYGEALDPITSGAFYTLKLAFLAQLEVLWSFRPPADGGFDWARGLSVAWIVLAVALVAHALRRTPATSAMPGLPLLTALVLLLSPTVPYLAGKLLAEPFGLAAAMLSITAFAHALATPVRPGRHGFAIAGFLALGLVAASRLNLIPLVFGYLAARGLESRDTDVRRRARALCIASGLAGGGAVVALFAITPTGLAGLPAFTRDFLAAGKSPLVSLLGTLAACGWLLPLGGLGAVVGAEPARRFLLTWCLVTTVPSLALVVGYQVEARYLVGCLVPVAGLAGLALLHGYARLASTSPTTGRRTVAICAAAAIFTGGNGLALSVLPYEVDHDEMRALMERDVLRDPRARLLVPWGYSDYHYLVTLWPDRPIYFVHVPRDERGLRPYDAEWRKRLERWYGDRFLAGPQDLARLGEDARLYYLSWERHPPIERWAHRVAALGARRLSRGLLALAGASHSDQSWVVEEPGLELVREPGSALGAQQYTLSRLVARTRAAR